MAVVLLLISFNLGFIFLNKLFPLTYNKYLTDFFNNNKLNLQELTDLVVLSVCFYSHEFKIKINQ